jgi:hypothetical protein
MRTTKKEFKEQVQKHILESVADDLTIKDVANSFYKEKYSSPYEKRFNKYDMFKDWMQGLPSSLNVEYTHHNIHNELSSWFEACGEEYKGSKNMDESDMYYHLVTREFRSLCKKEGIDF